MNSAATTFVASSPSRRRPRAVLRLAGCGLVYTFLSVAAVCPAGAAAATGEQAITLTTVVLDIARNGKKVGSTQLPPGRNVQVVGQQEGRVKIVASPLVSGWVDRSAVRISGVAASSAPDAPSLSDQTPASADTPKATDADPVRGNNAGSAPSASPKGAPATLVPSNTPEKSSLKIKETVWTEDFKTDPKEAKESERQMQLRNPGVNITVSTKCRGVKHKFLFTPTVSLGKDAEAGDPKLRVWVIEEGKNPETKKRKIRVTEPRTFPPPRVTGDISKPMEYEYMEWKCNCCRFLNGREFMGWYAELRAGDKVLVSAKSALVPKAQEALDEFLAAGSASGGR